MAKIKQRRLEMGINLETLKTTRAFFGLKLRKETLTERERDKYLGALRFIRECLKQNKKRDRKIKAKYYREHKDQHKGSNKMFTLYEVAGRTNLHYNTIYNYVRLGKLKAIKFKRIYRVEERELERLDRKISSTYRRSTYNKKFLKYYNKYQSERSKTDIKFRLNRNIGRLIRKVLKGNKAGRSWEFILGYTLNDLIKRLKNTMPVDYTWQDFMQGKLHIDHIIPIKAFNFTKPEHTDFKRCWALENMRLLPAKENMIKHNKLDKPFQPALRI